MIARFSTSVAPGYTASELKVAADTAQKNENQRQNSFVRLQTAESVSALVEYARSFSSEYRQTRSIRFPSTLCLACKYYNEAM